MKTNQQTSLERECIVQTDGVEMQEVDVEVEGANAL
jgi:hypothetical protein